MTPKQKKQILAAVVALLGAGTAPWSLKPLLCHFKLIADCGQPAVDPCSAHTVSVAQSFIATGGGDSRVIAGDSEVGSNDWTRVEVTYGIEPADNDRSLRMNLTWFTQELNGNKSTGDTRIRSKQSFTLYSAPSECPDLRIARTEGLALSLTDSSNDYRGQVHSVVPYPDAGSLRSVRVQFDHSGSGDDKVQSFSATVAPFKVQLERAAK